MGPQSITVLENLPCAIHHNCVRLCVQLSLSYYRQAKDGSYYPRYLSYDRRGEKAEAQMSEIFRLISYFSPVFFVRNTN